MTSRTSREAQQDRRDHDACGVCTHACYSKLPDVEVCTAKVHVLVPQVEQSVYMYMHRLCLRSLTCVYRPCQRATVCPSFAFSGVDFVGMDCLLLYGVVLPRTSWACPPVAVVTREAENNHLELLAATDETCICARKY